MRRALVALTVIASLQLGCEVAHGADPAPAASQFDGQRAYGYLRGLCALGNRMSGSVAMQKQQRLLKNHFQLLKLYAQFQRFTNAHPVTRQPVPLTNIVVACHPQRRERILLCAHYDTRPLPSQDVDPRQRREGVFLGANDGASGTAVLMELAHHVTDLPERYGVDLVFFDAEELVYSDRRDPYFLGSEHFARQYLAEPPPHRYVAGVLLDMVGDTQLGIYQEGHSVAWDDTRPIVQGIWSTAARLGVHEFIPRVGYEVRDDHLPLHNIAGIPVCDVIDFQYPDRGNGFWHTTLDTPGRCSAKSLGKVGRVLLEWLRSAE